MDNDDVNQINDVVDELFVEDKGLEDDIADNNSEGPGPYEQMVEDADEDEIDKHDDIKNSNTVKNRYWWYWK